ncbi:MAG: hypothetical protein V1820_01345 [archaeon]
MALFPRDYADLKGTLSSETALKILGNANPGDLFEVEGFLPPEILKQLPNLPFEIGLFSPSRQDRPQWNNAAQICVVGEKTGVSFPAGVRYPEQVKHSHPAYFAVEGIGRIDASPSEGDLGELLMRYPFCPREHVVAVDGAVEITADAKNQRGYRFSLWALGNLPGLVASGAKDPLSFGAYRTVLRPLMTDLASKGTPYLLETNGFMSGGVRFRIGFCPWKDVNYREGRLSLPEVEIPVLETIDCR